MNGKICFIGTGAADWNMKTDIDDPEFRGQTCILLDDHILIDFSVGGYLFAERKGMKDIFSKVDTVFYTHSHGDHFDAKCLKRLCEENKTTITVYADKFFENLLPECENLVFKEVDSTYHKSIEIDGYTVTALKSNHSSEYPEEQTHHYYFKGKNKNIFFGFDGGWLIADTWKFLQSNPIDVYVIDSTCGEDCTYNYRNFSHNNTVMRDLIIDTCKNNGVMSDSSVVIKTHLAKTLHPSHDEVVKKSALKGYLVAYDGMIYEF